MSCRLLNIVAKLGTTNFGAAAAERPSTSIVPSAAASSPFPSTGPSLSDDSRFNDPILATQSLESHLKRQSLECLVSILRSLVEWAAKGGVVAGGSVGMGIDMVGTGSSQSLARMSDDVRGASEIDLAASSAMMTPRLESGSGSGTPTREREDESSRFENAKQRKTTLLEGIKKFNFKPKRVSIVVLPGGT